MPMQLHEQAMTKSSACLSTTGLQCPGSKSFAVCMSKCINYTKEPSAPDTGDVFDKDGCCFKLLYKVVELL